MVGSPKRRSQESRIRDGNKSRYPLHQSYLPGESTLRVVFFHTSFLLFVPLEEEKELKRQRVKEDRNTEELEEGT